MFEPEKKLTRLIRNSLIIVVGILGLWLFAIAAGSPKLVAEKSKIDFVGSKASASHKGGFKSFRVEGNIDWGDFAKSSLKIEIDTASIWSDDGGLTSHLKNRDFFDAEKFPKIQFDATKIELGSDGTAIVSGRLKMLGQTVDISSPCKFELSDVGLVVTSKLSIDRTKWGMNYGQGRVNNDVDLSVALVLAR